MRHRARQGGSAPDSARGRAALGPAGDFQAATGVSRETLERLEAYVELLRSWQRTHNLVGRSTMDGVWHRHMLDSAQLLPFLPPHEGPEPRTIADLGSGAGFPGLVLALMGAGRVHLIESNAKKAAFLRLAVAETGTTAVVHAARAENLGCLGVDVVTSRALAPLADLLELVALHVRRGGCALLHKGARVEEELTAACEYWHMNVERLPSVTDPAASLLRIDRLARRCP